ncbi:MAG TPA: APC family permease [Steroidobacteraceae bacterium]|nr:APC family permease [Steroidobacteraceae bacterium]
MSAAAAEQRPAQGAVGFPTALATAVGLIMASPVILTVTSGFGMGGWAFAVAVAFAFIVMQAQATSFGEAAAILPTTGSVYDYISCGLGRFCAITGTISAYLLVHVFAGTAETVLSGIMALVNFQSLNTVLERSGTSWLVGVGMVLLFAATNALGIRVYGRIEIVLTAGMWLTLMIFGIAGILHAPAVPLAGVFGASSVGTDLPSILSLVGMAMFMFVGFEFVTPLAAEIREPARQIPRAMRSGLWAVALCMFTYGIAIRRQVLNVPVDASGTQHLLDTPMAIPQFAESVMGPFGRVWLGIGLLFAGAATINTLMAGLPRILYGMAIDGALPRAFAYLHPRLKTPLVGIAVSAAIPCLHAWYIHGDVDRLANLVLAAVCAWSVAYILVALSVISLRLRRPDLPRPYRAPWFPVPQIVSIAGIVIAMVYIAPAGTRPGAVFVPFGTMLALTAAYAFLWTRFVRRVPLFEPVPVEKVLAEELGRSSAAQP